MTKTDKIKKILRSYLMEKGYTEQEADIYLKQRWSFVEAVIAAAEYVENGEVLDGLFGDDKSNLTA